MAEGLAGDAGLVAAGGAVAVALLKTVEGVLARRQTPQQKEQTDTKTVAEAVAEAVPALSEAWSQMNAGMREDFDDLRRAQKADRIELAALRQSHGACEQRCEALTQLGRKRDQLVESLIRQLADPAATQPGGSLYGVIVELREGGALILPDKSESQP